jgi:type IV pilus assembly protein PilQ
MTVNPRSERRGTGLTGTPVPDRSGGSLSGTCRVLRGLLWSLGVLLGVLASVPASASIVLPVFEGIEANQGGNMLILEAKGTALPLPVVRGEESGRITLFWPGVSLPAGGWERVYNLPMLDRISLMQEERGLRMDVESPLPLSLKAPEGVPPLRRISLFFSPAYYRPQGPSPTPPPPAPAAGDPLQRTTPVTIDVRDMELRSVFLMLGRMMKCNIVCDPSLPTESVTLSLKDVPFNQAMNYLLRMYDIRYALVGNTILVGKRENLARTLGRETTRVFRIGYGDPKTLPALIQGLVDVQKVVVDERLRELYVTASPEILDEVARFLERIDHPGRQVMVQARIIQVAKSDSDEVEASLSAVYKHWYFTYGPGGGVIGYIDSNKPDRYDPDYDDDELLRPPEGIEPENIMKNTMRMLDGGLRAVTAKGNSNVLAQPTVIAVDGEKAVVRLTQQIKYVSGRDDAGNPTYGDVEAGPTLEIVPSIGREGMITLAMKLATGDVTFKESSSFQVPESNKQEVETRVRVRNGEPFVVGGLFDTRRSESVSKIPILGDLPLLGTLFRTTSKSEKTTEVIMIIVPYILDIPEGGIESTEIRRSSAP